MATKSCPFCGLTDDHTDICYFTLKAAGATISELNAAWNRRSVSAPTAAEQRSIDSYEFRDLVEKYEESSAIGQHEKGLRTLIAYIDTWAVRRERALREEWEHDDAACVAQYATENDKLKSELRAARSAAEAVPAGFKLVPIEPTDEMRTACRVLNYSDDIDAEWSRMIGAAPAPGNTAKPEKDG